MSSECEAASRTVLIVGEGCGAEQKFLMAQVLGEMLSNVRVATAEEVRLQARRMEPECWHVPRTGKGERKRNRKDRWR